MEYSVMWILAAHIYGLFCLVHTDEGIPTEEDIDMYQKEVVPRISLEKVQLPLLIRGEPFLSPRGRRPGTHISSDLEDFPPGRPSQANIDNICRKNRNKVSYGPHNLPQTGYGHLSRQGKAINDLEEGFTRCCLQREPLPCAEDMWENVLSTFCDEEGAVKTAPHVCCKKRVPSLIHSCFASKAPFPEYDREVDVMDLGAMTGEILEKLCRDHKLLTKTKHLPLLVTVLRDSCCTLPQDRKLGCAEEQKKKYITNFCSSRRDSWRDSQGCCTKSEQERGECFGHYLTVFITQR